MPQCENTRTLRKTTGDGHPAVRQMIAAARSNDTFLMEAIWTRFMPPIGKALEIINSGAIGELNSVKADLGFAANFDPDRPSMNKIIN